MKRDMKESRSGRSRPKANHKGEEIAPHAIWSGTVSFSLVAIPVQLMKAVEPGRVSFHLLHRADNSPLVRRMFCPGDEKPVPPDEIIRGYEIGPDQYIPVTEEELESVTPERSRTIEIMEFIDMKEVDPVYYDHPYYLAPLKGGEKSYRLLAEVMARTGKAGLARFVLGEREYLVAVTAAEGALSVITLHYHEEVLAREEGDPGEANEEAPEKEQVKRVIKGMIARFDPGKYGDRRREQMLKLLKKKGKEITPVEAPQREEEEGQGPVDLIAVLRESMDRAKGSR